MIHKLTYPLKTPSCGMFLASLSAPPLTRFVCNLVEFVLISAKGFRSNSMSETACCCQRNAVSLLDKRRVAACAFTAFYLLNVDPGTMIRYYSLNDSVTDARYSDWRPFCSFPKASFWLYQRIGSKDDNNSEQWRKCHSKRRISQSPLSAPSVFLGLSSGANISTGVQIVPHLKFNSGSRARIRFTYCFISVFSVRSNFQAAVHAILCLDGLFPFICTLPDATRADSWG